MSKKTIVYVSDEAKYVFGFLKYLAEKMEEESKNYKLDFQNVLLETDNYMIVGKSLGCGKTGAGYGNFEYLTVSSRLTKNDVNYRDKLQLIERNFFNEILFHARPWTKEISELEMLYVLEIV